MSNIDNQKYSFGQHYCAIYQDEAQQFSSLIPFFQQGLESHQRCIFALDRHTQKDVIDHFSEAGVDLHPYLKSGQMKIVPKEQIYPTLDQWDYSQTLDTLKTIQAGALQDGFSGFFGASEATWPNKDIFSNLIAYEKEIDALMPNLKAAILCQYSEPDTDKDLLCYIIRTHQYLNIYGNYYENKFFYIPPELSSFDTAEFSHDSYQAIIDIIIQDSK